MTPLPPDMTPEARLLKLAEFFEELQERRPLILTESIAELRALAALAAAPPPAAPQKVREVPISSEAWAANPARDLAYPPPFPTLVASPALDHEALVTRLTALADALYKSADVLRALTTHTTLAYTRDEVLGYQVNAANLIREAAVALRAAPSAPAATQGAPYTVGSNHVEGERSWCCRVHPFNWWHEVGCPHVQWTHEQLAEVGKIRGSLPDNEEGSPVRHAGSEAPHESSQQPTAPVAPQETAQETLEHAALRAIARGLGADNCETGDFWEARQLLDSLGVYNGDLSGTRVLLELARKALTPPSSTSGAPR